MADSRIYPPPPPGPPSSSFRSQPGPNMVGGSTIEMEDRAGSDQVPLKQGDSDNDPQAKSPGGRGLPNIKMFISVRAIVVVFLTLVTICSSVSAFVFIVLFRDSLTTKLVANFRGDIKSEVLPCIRSTLDLCANDKDDECWDRCCPPGYVCRRSPTVGLCGGFNIRVLLEALRRLINLRYCADGANTCGAGGDEELYWCRDYAEIESTCKTPACKQKTMAALMTLPVQATAAFGVVFDIFDVVIFLGAADSVVVKSTLNLVAACVKAIAFAMILGSGVEVESRSPQDYMTKLVEMRCYNTEGELEVSSAGQYLWGFVTSEVVSALFSLILAPLSAYFGGKLTGVPYVK